MRIDRIDLTRYGRFTDASLAFGAAAAAKPDLHIVYGDNEAGKTTMLNATLDLLFGIEAATPYKFLHQAPALRLGGSLEIGGDSRDVIRVPKAALLDLQERPLPEGLFSQELAGLDRASFQTMFSLDEKTLSAGGESILASEGDLGQLLFSATAGLADFAQALTRLRAEADAFYRTHGRKHDLGDLKKRLLELKERRTAIDVAAAPFAKLIAARDEAATAYRVAVEARGRLQADLEAVRRQLATLPRLAEWTRLRAELDQLPETPGVPPGWTEEIPQLQKTLVTLRTRRTATKEELARLDDDIASLPCDDAGLAIAARIQAWSGLAARNATAVKDLPGRRAALRAGEAKVAHILRDLGREGHLAPRTLLLTTGVTGRLRALLESLSGTLAERQKAATELADAKARHGDVVAELQADGSLEDAASRARLEEVLAAAEADDSSTRLRLAERAIASHDQVLADELAALAPRGGDVDALLSLDVAAERRACLRLSEELAAALAALERARTEASQFSDVVLRAQSFRDALVISHGGIEAETAAASRSARDGAWVTHLESFDRDSAASFERAMRADDAITSGRLAQAAVTSEIATLERSLHAAKADLEVANRRLIDTERTWHDVKARVSARFGPFVGEECATPLAAFDAFLAARERALATRRLALEARADRSSAIADGRVMHEQLAAALAAVGVLPVADTLATLVSAARGLLRRQDAARLARRRLDELAQEVAERTRQVHRAEEGVTAWHEAWTQTLQSTWLEGDDVAHVRDVLAGLADLAPALELCEDLADRVAKMEADQAAFACAIREAGCSLGWPEDGDVEFLAARVTARGAEAERTAVARASRIADRRKAEDRLADLAPTLEAAERREVEMTSRFAAATLDDLALIFEASRRRDELAARTRTLANEICDACAISDVEEARSALAAKERDELERCGGELETLLEAAVESAQHRFAERERARHAVDAVDGDATAARLEEERHTVLLEIEERSLAHLALRAGIIAAESAIGLYRDRHRSTMMAHASELFANLTRGAYGGLAAQSQKGGEVLVGLVSGGGSKLSTEMSTATRNQLYLALRIAAYREFTKARRPLPFVLDDVLETFDDDRAEASLSLLADMARTGQVIYLTHHKHLCAIAQRVCPDAKLHDLGSL